VLMLVLLLLLLLLLLQQAPPAASTTASACLKPLQHSLVVCCFDLLFSMGLGASCACLAAPDLRAMMPAKEWRDLE